MNVDCTGVTYHDVTTLALSMFAAGLVIGGMVVFNWYNPPKIHLKKRDEK